MMRRWMPFLALYAGLITIGLLISWQVPAYIDLNVDAEGVSRVSMTIALISFVYMLASAVPFVPGAEIGLGLIAAFGARIALWVYLCMVIALCIAYVLGRMIPPAVLARGFRYLYMIKPAELVETLAAMPTAEREGYLHRKTSNKLLHWLLSYRYIALALAINMPGNTLLGGGGGLALFAGMSRLFSPIAFLVTVLIAVAPIPLTVFMMGYQP